MDFEEKAQALKEEVLRWQKCVQGGYPVAGTLNQLLSEALREAARFGAEQFRERAAHKADVAGHIYTADRIRALPLDTGEEGGK